jgi:tetratricopeptide (TPR) repeat protein
MRHLAFLALLCSTIGLNPLAGQSTLEKVPKRPRLAADADTNSALAYYAHGVAVLDRDPEKAAAVFYWASRLEPTWAAPFFGQYAAELLTLPTPLLTDYLLRRKNWHRNRQLQRLDSLANLALVKNPFVDRRFDGIVLSTWIERGTGGRAQLRDLGMYDRYWTARAALARGDFKMAHEVFDELIRKSPDDPELRFWRAHAFVGQGQMDSARAAVQSALGITRSIEADLPFVGWASHAYTEYCVGFLFELTGQLDSARTAYGRALLDDLSFHPAHRQLAKVRLAMRDTVGALAELREASTLAPGNGTYLYDLGMLLTVTGQADSGMATLLRATAAEPYYAPPHYTLGLLYQHSGFTREAAEHYTTFLSLAPRTMGPAIAAARERLAALEGKP